MWRLSANATPDAEALVNGAFFPPMTDHTARRVVMPSPDLLYALCSFDLSAGPWRIQADPRTPQYWSVALYAANSDNFWVGNDAEAHGRPLDVLLLRPTDVAATHPALPGCTTLVDSQGLAAQRHGAAPGSVVLLRPDQHVCARWLTLDATRLQAALNAALPQ